MALRSKASQDVFGTQVSKKDAPDVVYEAYVRDATRFKLLTLEEERRLTRLARSKRPGAEAARKTLSECNLRLVLHLARRFQGRGLPLLDLVQEGNLGLMHAIMKYDVSRGYRFSTYATWWINQSMQRALLGSSRVVRVPICALDISAKARNAAETIRQATYREPDMVDLAKVMKRSPIKLAQAMRGAAGLYPASLEYSFDNGESSRPTSIGGRLEAPEEIPPALDRAELRQIMEQLKPREQWIIMRRFGLDGQPPSTLSSLARKLGVSRERIRQLQYHAIARLRVHRRNLLNGWNS